MLTILGCSLLLQVILGSITSGLQAERNGDLRGVAIRLAGSEIAQFKMKPFDEIKAGTTTAEPIQYNRPFKVVTTTSVPADAPEHLREIAVVVTWKAGARDVSYATTVRRSRL